MTDEILDLLQQARRNGRAAAFDSSLLPVTSDAAYRAILPTIPPEHIVAWKIGGANPWSQQVFRNKELFFGPLLDSETALGEHTYSIVNLVSPLAEPEIMLELGPWPPHASSPIFTRMALGFEIPASVLPEAAKPVLCGQILDRAGAGGLWINTPVSFDATHLVQDFPVRFHKNDGPRAEGRGFDVFGGPLGSALLFLGQAVRRNAPLRTGQWIATGGMVPAIPVLAGDRLIVEAANMIADLLIV